MPPDPLLEQRRDLGADVLGLAAALLGLLVEGRLELVVLAQRGLDLALEPGQAVGQAGQRLQLALEPRERSASPESAAT